MRSTRLATWVLLLSSVTLAACGTTATPPITPSSRLVHVPGSRVGKIILSALGAQRIGLQTAPAGVVVQKPSGGIASHGKTSHGKTSHGKTSNGKTSHGKTSQVPTRREVTVPYSGVVYAPSGQTYVFSNPARLTYAEVRITVNHISGSVVFLNGGLTPGTRIVTVGAEELYGVQTGVLAQT